MREEFLRRYATSPIHVPRLERLLAAYGDGDPDAFAAAFIEWDRDCADPEAARIATELLALFVDDDGRVVRLTDDAVRGAVNLIAQPGAHARLERATVLRDLLSSTTPDAVAHATRFLEAAVSKPAGDLESLTTDSTRLSRLS
jgi:hypothetical protein